MISDFIDSYLKMEMREVTKTVKNPAYNSIEKRPEHTLAFEVSPLILRTAGAGNKSK